MRLASSFQYWKYTRSTGNIRAVGTYNYSKLFVASVTGVNCSGRCYNYMLNELFAYK